MIHCVTTMNQNYYDIIGKLMIKTWLNRFPDNYILHLYLEDMTLDIDDPRIVVEDWKEVQDLYNIWKDTRFSEHPRHQKFTKKAITQIAAWRKIKTGKMFWIDADVIFIDNIPRDLFDKILGDYPLASWGAKYFESGTVWINLDHPDFEKIKEKYESIYIGPDGIPYGERWYDGELLGIAVQQSGVRYLDLYPLAPKSSTPLNKSWIGKYMQHFKAKRKNKDNLESGLTHWGLGDLIKLVKPDP